MSTNMRDSDFLEASSLMGDGDNSIPHPVALSTFSCLHLWWSAAVAN